MTEQAVVPLVIVKSAPVLLQPPLFENVTGLLDPPPVAATEKPVL